MRIGTAEREEAQRALQEHLNAGRLQVNEYADRSARASGATTASEIAAVFEDLPAPRPKLPGGSRGGVLGKSVVAGVAVLVLAGLALVVGLGGRGGATSPPVAAPATAVPPPPPVATTTPAARATLSATTSPNAALPDGVQVRRATGSDAITLRPSYGVDLDNNTSDNWAVANSGTYYGRDVGSVADGGQLGFIGDYAVVTGTPEYATCARETGYTRGGIERGSLQPGETICVRTDQDRYALVTIVSADEQAIRFTAVVWDPVIPS